MNESRTIGAIADVSMTDDAGLETAGKAAWDASHFEVAAHIYERLARLHPDNRSIAFCLANSLARTGRMQEADHIFSRAMANGPNDYWMGYHWALRTYHSGNLDRAELIARRLMMRFPDRTGSYWLLGQISERHHDPASAVTFFESACKRDPTDTGLRDLAARARLYERVTHDWPPPSIWPVEERSSADYQIIFINLDGSTLRRTRLEEAFFDCPVPLHRLPGIVGNQLPMSIARSLVRSTGDAVKRGTLGCTLSHIAAWELVVAKGLRCCMIIEDDAVPTVRVPAHIRELNIPEDFDICFAQESTQPKITSEDRERITQFVAVPLIKAWITFPQEFSAPRTTGYFISTKGAARLLSYFAQDGARGDVDWRMVSYSVSGPQDLPEDSVGAKVVAVEHRRIQPFVPLITYSLYPCLVREQAVDWPRAAIDNDDRSI